MIRREKEVLEYSNRYFQVFDDLVTFNDGSSGKYIRIEHTERTRPSVVIMAICENSIGFVKTFRYPIGEWQWALPRGFGHSANVLESAARELEEELGCTSIAFTEFGASTPDSGILAQRVHYVQAEVSQMEGVGTDSLEVASIKWISMEDLWSDLGAGKIQDGFTLSAVALAYARDIIPGPCSHFKERG
jgi:8-oxo-dGTP pyrophosphatase MutT (NUDIX family)